VSWDGDSEEQGKREDGSRKDMEVGSKGNDQVESSDGADAIVTPEELEDSGWDWETMPVPAVRCL
jgi:hypothetical protein